MTAWSSTEGGRHGPRGDGVRDPQTEMSVGAGEAEGDLGAARMPSHITQPFEHDVKDLSHEPIVAPQSGRGLHVHGNPRGLGKPLGEALHCRQQAVSPLPTVP